MILMFCLTLILVKCASVNTILSLLKVNNAFNYFVKPSFLHPQACFTNETLLRVAMLL